jgi:hypothetical protein
MLKLGRSLRGNGLSIMLNVSLTTLGLRSCLLPSTNVQLRPALFVICSHITLTFVVWLFGVITFAVHCAEVVSFLNTVNSFKSVTEQLYKMLQWKLVELRICSTIFISCDRSPLQALPKTLNIQKKGQIQGHRIYINHLISLLIYDR